MPKSRTWLSPEHEVLSMFEESVDFFDVMLVCALSWLWGARSPFETIAVEPSAFACRNGTSLFVPTTGHTGSIPGLATVWEPKKNIPTSVKARIYQSSQHEYIR